MHTQDVESRLSKMLRGVVVIWLAVLFIMTGTAQAQEPAPIYHEDFETSDGGYTTFGTNIDWEWGEPSTWPGVCASGSRCWGTNLDGDYQHNSIQNLLSPIIDLSDVALPYRHRLKVSWWQAWDIGDPRHHRAYAQYRVDEGPWRGLWSYDDELWSPDDGIQPVSWDQGAFDITDAVGRTVQFRWRLTTDDAVSHAGLYIDDVRIYSEEAPSYFVDVSISMHHSPLSEADRAPYERIIEYFADGVFEASNGWNRVRRVTIYPNNSLADRADVVWSHDSMVNQQGEEEPCHPNAHVSGRLLPGWRVQMCDVFGRHNFIESENGWQKGGYVLAHEWGHYYYSLYDEYRGDGSTDQFFTTPHSTDDPVTPSIMNNSMAASCSYWLGLWQVCRPGQEGRFEWLNFSVDGPDNRNTAQYRVYEATGWETLARPLSEDPRDRRRTTRPQRIFHPGLANLDPGPIIMLPWHQDTARKDLDIVWASGDSTFQIVIDSSGSMIGSRMANAKAAAKLLVDLAEVGQSTIGVIEFASTPTVVQPLTPIDSQEAKETVKDAIDSIVAGGMTAIGDAAQLALDELLDHGAEDTDRLVYLLTDGQNNRGVQPLSVIPAYQDAGIPLYTFGYGPEVNHGELEQMASDTGGSYYRSPTTLEDLQQVVQDAAQLTLSTVGIVAGTVSAAPSAPAIAPIHVDSTLNRLNVSVSYPGAESEVDLVLRDPAGNPGDPASCSSSAGEVLCLFSVESPVAGSWSLEAVSSTPDVSLNYRASGLAEGTITYHTSLTSLTGTAVQYPEPMVLLATLGKEWPVSGAVVTGTIQNPDGSIAPLEFVDDGEGPDALADDGNYSAILDYSQDGVYNITVEFNNSAGTAHLTPIGLLFSPGYDGEAIPMPDPVPITEDFQRFARLQITVSGWQADDHGNVPSEATVILADNRDVPGRIDYPGDVDVFQFEALQDGELIVRVANLAGGMDPRLRLFGADGSEVLADINLTTSSAERGYLYLPIDVDDGDVFFAEVSHTREEGLGFYDISVGTRLSSERRLTDPGPKPIGGATYPTAWAKAPNLWTGLLLVGLSVLLVGGVVVMRRHKN